MEAGEEGEYTPIVTLSPPEWRWVKRESIHLSLHCHHQNGDGWRGRVYTYRYTVTTRMEMGAEGEYTPIVTLSPPEWRWVKRESIHLSLHCHHQNGDGWRGRVYTYRYTVTTRMEIGEEGEYTPIVTLSPPEWRWVKRESIHLSLHCRHQNGYCIQTGSNESQFNVLLIVKDKVTRLCLKSTTFLKRKESRSGIEPRPFCLPA